MLNIERLNCDSIETKPVTIDWQKALGKDCEGWRAFEAFECPECGKQVVASMLGEHECRDLLPEVEEPGEDGDPPFEVDNTCHGTIYAEGPMMNYWYPVRINDCEEAAKAIAHLPLCVVEFEDSGDTGLALTGGGMDLSWEICEAFICLGYRPPLHFCDLPKMAGRGKSEKDLAIISACEESCRIAEGWAARKRERLGELREWTKSEK